MAISQIGIADDKSGDGRIHFDIPQQRADLALTLFAEQANLTLIFPYDVVRNRNANRLVGKYSVQEAAEILLQGTGLKPSFRNQLIMNIAAVEHKAAEGDEMKVKKKGLGALLASIFLASGAGAVESIDEDMGHLEEIIVTASKREQRLQDVPMATTSINPADFLDAGLGSTVDIITYTPGFVIGTAAGDGGPRGTGAIGARGVNQQSTTPVVGIYLDDIPLSSNSPHGSGNLFYFDGTQQNLERIELLKGPQGTLYGAVSIGGAIKYVTRRPDLENYQVDATADLSTIEDGGLQQLYRGRVNLPIFPGKAALSLSGFIEDSDGFVDRVDSETGALVDEDFDSSDSYGYSADFLLAFTDRMSFRGRYLKQDVSWDGLSQLPIEPGTLEPTHGSRNSVNEPTSTSLVNDLYSGTLEYRLDGAEITSTTGYYDWEQVRREPLNAATLSFLDSIVGNTPGTTTAGDFGSDRGSKRWTEEIRITSTGDNSIEWLVGLYYTNETTTTASNFIGMPGGFNFLTRDSQSEYTEYAAFGDLTYYLAEDFDVTVGARLSRNTLEFDPVVTGALAGIITDADRADVQDTVPSYLFTGRYRPTDDVSLYARVASGYRPAFGTEPFIDPVTNEPLNSKVESDSLWSYEIGAKGELAAGLLSYDFAIWYLNWNDFQANVTTAVGIIPGNAEGITAKGVEGAISLRPRDGLTVDGSFVYTDSTLDEDEPALQGLEGDSLPGVPKWSAAAKARYEFQLFSGVNAYIAGGVRYTGEKASAFEGADSTSLAFNLPTEAAAILDLSAGATIDHLAFRIYATNLLDSEKYISTNFSTITGGSGVPYGPRTIGGAISISF